MNCEDAAPEFQSKTEMEPVCDYVKLKGIQEKRSMWKFSHLCFYTGIVLFSFMAVYTFVYFSGQLGDVCFFNAKLVKKSAVENRYNKAEERCANSTIENHSSCRLLTDFPDFYRERYTILWGNANSCYVYQILGTLSMIAGVVAFVFTLITYKGGQVHDHDALSPDRLVIPFSIVCICCSLTMVYNNVKLQKETDNFCAEFSNYTGFERCTKDLDTIGEVITGADKYYYITYLILTSSSQVTMILWICQLILYILRVIFVVDYSIEKITVYGKRPYIQSEEARSALKKLLGSTKIQFSKGNQESTTSV